MLFVYLLFLFSGISGLAYQIIWARQLGLVFGNTDYAVATTLSVFMFGLGIGSLVVGLLSDRFLETVGPPAAEAGGGRASRSALQVG